MSLEPFDQIVDPDATHTNPASRKHVVSEARVKPQRGHFEQRHYSAMNESTIPVKKKSDRPIETNKVFSQQNLSFAYMKRNPRAAFNRSPPSLAMRVRSELRHYKVPQGRKPKINHYDRAIKTQPRPRTVLSNQAMLNIDLPMAEVKQD